MNWRQELAEQAQAATPGPYYTAPDPAPESPHADSGLSMIETGRQGDWPPAMLMEAPQADYFAACTPERIQKLLAVAAAGERVKRHTDARLDTGNVLDKIRNAKARLTAMADLFDALAKLEGTP